MEWRYAVGINEYKRMDTRELRENFLIDNLFVKDALTLVYWETDRTVTGAVVPMAAPLLLENPSGLASEFFCQRRELGVMNLGGPGTISVDGVSYPLDTRDGLYIGSGSREVLFGSDSRETPAEFFLMSYPAHAAYPTTLVREADANRIELGSSETANRRVICQYIHENGVKSCQLVMGITQLNTGSVWNTMPAHTHARRSEVYCYFDVPQDAAAFHFMGPQEETRHIVVQKWHTVLSPIWSIHSGCGTSAYSFLWAMGGENQRFADMDAIAIADLK